MGQVKEAEGAEPVCNGNDDDFRILLNKIVAVKHRIHRSSRLEASAMDPYQYRLLS